MATLGKSPLPPSTIRLNPWTKPPNAICDPTRLSGIHVKRLIDSPAALHAAKKQRLREVLPKDGPTVKISKGKDKRFRVYVGLNDGSGRRFNSTAKTQEDARDMAQDFEFLAGIGPDPRERAV